MLVYEFPAGRMFSQVAQKHPPFGNWPVGDMRCMRGKVERPPLRSGYRPHQRMHCTLEFVLFFFAEFKAEDFTRVNDGVMHMKILDRVLDFVTQGIIGSAHVGKLSVSAYIRNNSTHEQGVTTRRIDERRIGMPEAVAEVGHAAAIVSSH